MANERRVRANYAFGTLSVPLAAGDVSISSLGLSDLPAIGATEHAALTINDPNTGNYEIVYITSKASAGATTATIVRGREGTTAQAWSAGAGWVHAPTSRDLVLAENPRAIWYDDCDTPTPPDGFSTNGAGSVAWDATNRARLLTGAVEYFTAPFAMPSHEVIAEIELQRINAYTTGSITFRVVRGGVGAAGTQVGLLMSLQTDGNDVIYYSTGTTSGTASGANALARGSSHSGKLRLQIALDVTDSNPATAVQWWEAAVIYGLSAQGPVRVQKNGLLASPNNFATIAAGDILQVGCQVNGTATAFLSKFAVTA